MYEILSGNITEVAIFCRMNGITRWVDQQDEDRVSLAGSKHILQPIIITSHVDSAPYLSR